MKSPLPITLGLAALLASSSSIHAASIDGSINFSSGGSGGVTIQGAGDLSTATGVFSWLSPEVDLGNGSFVGIVGGTPVALLEPWVFSTPSSVIPLWTISGPDNFSFYLTSAVVTQVPNFLGVVGSGFLTGTNFTQTAATWRFTSVGPDAGNGVYNWSSTTTSVPDPGTTLFLLGGSLVGVFGLRRKFGRS